jgi:hypothetical protein
MSDENNLQFPAPPYTGEAHEHVPSGGDAEICERCENYHTNPTHIRHPDGVAARVFRPRPVTRPDCGSQLYAPVDQFGVESGLTPSLDWDGIKKACDDLNAKNGVR